jgi:AcrR family transcriptional regulator
MKPTEIRLKKKEELRDSILEAVKAIVLKEGWQAVSMRKIAEAIGYSLPVVYNHFQNKDAILEEFVKQGFTMLAAVMARTKAKSEDAATQLNEMALAYFDFAFSHREYYQMMFGLGMPSCERVSKITEIGNFTAVLIDPIKQLGGSTTVVPKTILKFHTFWSILHGLSSINMVNITATPGQMQQQVLQDAVQGFINNINN